MNPQQSVPRTNSPEDSIETADILAEMHALRAKHAAEHGNDPESITQDLIAGFLKDHPDFQWVDIAPAAKRL
ncbi:MAG: hypothetical protein ACLQVN_18355 [Bryobacteraceae bacterium]